MGVRHWRSGGPHCPTCSCEPRYELCIYPPNVTLYGRCGTCGKVRWQTEEGAGGGEPVRASHCGCCAHPHTLPPGSHERTCVQDPATCPLGTQ